MKALISSSRQTAWLLFLGAAVLARAQVSVPPIQWQRVFGGTGEDVPLAMIEDNQGALILGLQTDSGASGNKASTSFGMTDYWVVRLNDQGDLLWERTFGGSGVDILTDLLIWGDGSILVCGSSGSPISGNKTTTGLNFHGWLVCLNELGDKRWEKSIDGDGNDSFVFMDKTHDGGVILVAASTSGIGGDKSAGPYGMLDVWLVRLDAQANILWDRSFGGDAQDIPRQARQTSDLGFIVIGTTYSGANGNKETEQFGQGDVWVLRLDAMGHKLWERDLGGTGWDQGQDIYETSDGGFMVFANSRSGIDGTKTSPHYGDFDAWFVKLDAQGNSLWDRTVGGPNSDELFRVCQTWDRGFLVGASSRSATNSSGTSTNHGSADGWILRLDKDGNELWQDFLGGTDAEVFPIPTPAHDGGYVLTMQSRSIADGNKTLPGFGRMDAWVVKTRPDVVMLRSNVQHPSQIREQGFRLQLSGPSSVYAVEYSTNLAQWELLREVVLTDNAVEIIDPAAADSSHRVYRARSNFPLGP